MAQVSTYIAMVEEVCTNFFYYFVQTSWIWGASFFICFCAFTPQEVSPEDLPWALHASKVEPLCFES